MASATNVVNTRLFRNLIKVSKTFDGGSIPSAPAPPNIPRKRLKYRVSGDFSFLQMICVWHLMCRFMHLYATIF